MAGRNLLFFWIDQNLDGTLADRLKDWHSAGLSFDQIARELADLGLPASRETVRRWVKEVETA